MHFVRWRRADVLWLIHSLDGLQYLAQDLAGLRLTIGMAVEAAGSVRSRGLPMAGRLWRAASRPEAAADNGSRACSTRRHSSPRVCKSPSTTL